MIWKAPGQNSGGMLPDWAATAHLQFGEQLLAAQPGYPCHFGVRGQIEGNNWFCAIDDRNTDEATSVLASALREFQGHAWQGAKRQTLMVFVGPPHATPNLELDHDRFWTLLSSLAAADADAWPVDVPRDINDPHWQWCFAGEPWFVFGCSPAYRLRHSRNVGPCLTLVFQVRRVFEGLSGSSPAGQAAKARIRADLATYDVVPVHPHLGDPLHSSSFKWRQYFLPDDEQVLAPQACPFKEVGRG